MEIARTQCEDIVAAPPSERREGKRHTAVLLIGRADFGGRAHACLVLNISEKGLMARFLAPPHVGEPINVQLRGLGPAEATVRWTRGACAGMEFTAPQPLAPVLNPSSVAGQRPRTPRFAIARDGLLEVNGATHPVHVTDVSVGGMTLTGAPRLRMESHARLRLVDTPLIFAGTLCWQEEERLGLEFVRPLTLQKLAEAIGDA